MTILNMLIFATAFLIQNIYGLIEFYFKNTHSVASSFKISFAIFLILQIATLSFFVLKKKSLTFRDC